MIRLRLLGPLDALGSDGAELRAVLAQPKRLTLLAYLAVEPGVYRRRDTLLALFWPEADAAQARLALRQALHHLRRALGPDVLVARAADEVGVAADALWCDVPAFIAAWRGGAFADALALYRGEFLAGVHAAGAGPELEEWVAGMRARLHGDAVRAARAEATRLADGSPLEAADRLAWAESLEPFDECVLSERVRLLLRARDPAAALRAVDAFAARVARELDLEPSTALRALAAEARATLASAPPAEPPAALAAADVDVPVLAVETLDSRTAPVAPGRVARERATGWPVTRWRPVVVGGAAACIAASLGTAAGTMARVPAATLVPAPAARGLYDEGLRALIDRGDAAAALPLFQAALRADSTCAPCAYQAAATIGAREGRLTRSPELAVAERLAARADPVDRLRIRYAAMTANEPTRIVLAESVLALHPEDPDAEVAVGSSLAHVGAYAAALPHLRRARALDSLGLRRGATQCAACEAEQALVADYWAMDSLPTAEREAEAWVQGQPRAAGAWGALAETFEREGRFDVARAAQAHRVALQGGAANDLVDRVRIALRAGAFAEAERVLQAMREDDNAETRAGALWFLIILRRDEGRLGEAQDLAGQFAAVPASQDRPGMPGTGAFPTAQVLFERGRWREAAVRWRALARVDTAYARVLPGEAARRRTWMLAQLATALGAAGDVRALAPLVDSVERAGAGSAYGRDHVLGQYVRGLVAELAGDLPGAEQAFRRAILSPTDGYTRVNVALARVLLAEGRAAEAPAILRPAFAGSVEASNYYVTRPELHEWLARAFDETGARDSAAAHWERVAAAWRDADPPLRARAALARARLRALADRSTGAARRGVAR